MIVQSTNPYNAEPEPPRLAKGFLTATDDFYVRSHGAVPDLDADHRIEIVGSTTRAWSVDELRTAFPERTLTATLQCAGNRRAHLQAVWQTAGDPWGVGAIGNAIWTGVALSDVLAEIGVSDGARFVRFAAADTAEVEGQVRGFEISIALEKAMTGEVLLAWGMNGAPLTPEHGAPLRLIVPGYAGIRSPKWLTRIACADSPSPAPIQAQDYMLFPPEVKRGEADWSKGLVIDALPVTSAIVSPADGADVPAGTLVVEGYAIASNRAVARVDLSADGGATWTQATLGEHERWAWTQWRCPVELGEGGHELVVRAVDAAGQMQPEQAASIWNWAGYCSTAWHRIAVTAGP